MKNSNDVIQTDKTIPLFPVPYFVPTSPQSKLTHTLVEKLCLLIGRGNPLSTAAAVCGVHEETLYGWKKKGRQDRGSGGETPYSILLNSIEQAEAAYEAYLVNLVNLGAETDPVLALHILARRFPERWGKHRRNAPREKVNVIEMIHEAMDRIKDNPIIFGMNQEAYEPPIPEEIY